MICIYFGELGKWVYIGSKGPLIIKKFKRAQEGMKGPIQVDPREFNWDFFLNVHWFKGLEKVLQGFKKTTGVCGSVYVSLL